MTRLGNFTNGRGEGETQEPRLMLLAGVRLGNLASGGHQILFS